MIRNRRKEDDRRRDVRYAVQIEIEWENSAGRQNGTISDISETGCFVLCSGAVSDGEKVKLFFPAKRKQTVVMSAEVTNHAYEIGFAARFVKIGYGEHTFLERLIAHFKQIGSPDRITEAAEK